MAKTNAAASAQPVQAAASNAPNPQSTYGQNLPSAVTPGASNQPFVPPVNAFGALNGSNPFGGMSSMPNMPQGIPQVNGQMNVPNNPPPPSQNAFQSPEQLQQQVQIIAMLQQQGVPQDQWANILQVLMAAGMGGAPGATGVGAFQPPQNPNTNYNQNQNQYGSRDDQSRDRNDGYGMRSPPGRHRRSRSRSPAGYDRRRDGSPPRRRGSPSYGNFGRNSDQSNRNTYRQRSPERGRDRRSDSPQNAPGKGSMTKFVDWDNSMPDDHIRGNALLTTP